MKRWSPLIVFVGLLLPVPVFGWHKDGHMAVARIAWQQLSKPQQDAAIKILKAHIHPGVPGEPPIDHFKVFLSADRPEAKKGVEITEDEWVFARAATWPDWVRDPAAETHSLKGKPSAAITKAFHKGPWHFINLPFVHPADQKEFGEAKLAELTKSVLEPEMAPVKGSEGKMEPRHAIAALKMALQALRDKNTSDADKAVKLCWVLHLVGDIHQPLHASALIARSGSLPPTKFDPPPAGFDPPAGDEGGNRLAIKTKEKQKDAVILHSFWDGLVFNDRKDFLDVEAQVQELIRDKQYQPKQADIGNTDYLSWAKDSLNLAKTVAYRTDGTPNGAFLGAIPLPIRKGKDARKQSEMDLQDLDAPLLSPDYQGRATDTAKRQIVLAGHRLAVQLKDVLP
jgi:hypothetical protein